MKIYLKDKREHLELLADVEVEFTQTNGLYDFEKEGEERTLEFQIPATSTNQRILDFDNSLHRYGANMRYKFDAYLLEGLIRFDGSLHLLDFDAEASCYNACFTFGGQAFWSNLRHLGKLSEITWMTAVKYVDNNGIYPTGNVLPNYVWEKVQYLNSIPTGGDYLTVLPCVMVSAYIRRYLNPALQRLLGVTVDLSGIGEGSVSNTVLLPNTLNFFNKVGTILLTRWSNTGSAPYYGQYRYYFIYSNRFVGPGSPDDAFFDIVQASSTSGALERVIFNNGSINTNFGHTFMTAKMDLEIEFSPDFPADVFLKRADVHIYNGFGRADDWTTYFIGGRGFRYAESRGSVAEVFGEPLAGRRVTLSAGDGFCLCKAADWGYFGDPSEALTFHKWYPSGDRHALYGYTGWMYYGGSEEISVSLKFRADTTIKCDLAVSSPLRIKGIAHIEANLPEVTADEFLKDLAMLHGALLYYDADSKTIKFDKSDYATPAGNDITNNLITHKTTSREVLDFNKINRVGFKDFTSYTVYKVDNEKLDSEANDIYELLAGEGEYLLTNLNNKQLYCTYKNNVEYEDYGMVYAKLQNDASPPDGYLQYFGTLPSNAKLTSLCTSSTLVEIEIYMTLEEYQKIQLFTQYYYKGHYWIWTEANWSEGITQLTLQMIK